MSSERGRFEKKQRGGGAAKTGEETPSSRGEGTAAAAAAGPCYSTHPDVDPDGYPWPAGSSQAALAGKPIAGGDSEMATSESAASGSEGTGPQAAPPVDQHPRASEASSSVGPVAAPAQVAAPAAAPATRQPWHVDCGRDGQTRQEVLPGDEWPDDLVKLDMFRCSELYAPEGTTLHVYSHDCGWHKVTLRRIDDDRKKDDDHSTGGRSSGPHDGVPPVDRPPHDDGRNRNDDDRNDDRDDGRKSPTTTDSDRSRNDGDRSKDDSGNRRDRNGDRLKDDRDDDARRVKLAHAEFATEVQMAIAKFEAAQVSTMMPPPSAVPQRPRKRQRLSSQLIYEHAKSVHLQAWAKQVAAKLMETAMQAKESALVAKNCINFFEFDSQFDEPSASATNLAVPRRLHV